MSSQGKKGKGLRELHEDLAKVREVEEAELKNYGIRLMRSMNKTEERETKDISFRTTPNTSCIA